MTIVVCIKQVPPSNDVKIDPATKNLVRDFQDGIMNPYDKNAVEAALQLKEKTGDRVVALSMGPLQFTDTLREALAMGCDDAVLLSARAFAGADTLATGYVLAKGIEKIGDVRLILFGRHAVDADTGQVGPIVAGLLGLPQATFVRHWEMTNENSLRVTRLLEKSEETVKITLPAVITVTGELNTPRYAVPIRIMKAAKAEIPVYNEQDLNCDLDRIGIAGSPTIVTSVFAPPKSERTAIILTGEADKAAQRICALLDQKKII